MKSAINWDEMNEQERNEFLTPHLENLKNKMIRAKGVTVSTNFDWIDIFEKRYLAGETIEFELRYS